MTFETILSPDNFELAWRRIRNSPITTTKDRLGLKVFSQALDVHIDKLIDDLYDREYEPQSPSILYLPKKSGRLRPFTLLNMRDRLVYQAIGNILIRNTYEQLIPIADVSVFSPVLTGIDADFVFYPALKRGEDFEGQYIKFTQKQAEIINSLEFDCVVYADIANFYPSIDHNLLINKILDNNWLDNESCDLLRTCLEVWSSEDPKLIVRKGLPIGYETSALLANLFLYEIDEFLSKNVYLRYVDDIRVFAANQSSGEQILNELDVALQKQGLALQSAKSKVDDLSDLSVEEQLHNLKTQQILLSGIDQELNSPYELDQTSADEKLRNLIIEILGITDWEALKVDGSIQVQEETSFFFALYRIREKNILLRDISLDLLHSHPHRSYAIVRYLTLFRDDEIVFGKLREIIDDKSKHGQVRANCLRGLYELSENLDEIRDIARTWINSDDLSLSFCGIEIIQQFSEEKQFLLDLVDEIQTPQIRYSLVSTTFTLMESYDEKIKLIERCLNDDDYMIISLGVFFLSTEINLLPQVVEHPVSLVEDLTAHILKQIAPSNLGLNLQKLFELQDSLVTVINSILSQVSLNQLTINMILSKETNRDEYLRNLAEFLTKFAEIYQNITDKRFTSLMEADETDTQISNAFEFIKIGLMNLSDFNSSVTFLGTKPALSHYDTEILHEGVSKVVKMTLEELEEMLRVIPEDEQDEILTTDEKSIPMIFFSYSHDDDKERNTLKKKLKYLETRGIAQLWSDRKIPAGQVWSLDIEEKLNASSIVLFLISSNFMGSDFIHKQEMPRAIRNYENQLSVCIPIILEACDWEFEPYKDLQALPEDAKPITQWLQPDLAYNNIQVKIREVLELLENNKYVWKPLPKK